MNIFPTMIQLKTKESLLKFSKMYVKASSLPIPDSYLHHPENRVFGIFWQQELIGGFILGNCSDFRTISVFAKEENHEELYQQLGDKGLLTEICCFWIKKSVRSQTFPNFFIWLSMAYALRRYGSQNVLFGTCSRSLARLYAVTPKANLISQDFINNKSTFIFQGEQRYCIPAILEIICFKLKRTLKLSKRWNFALNPQKILFQQSKL